MFTIITIISIVESILNIAFICCILACIGRLIYHAIKNFSRKSTSVKLQGIISEKERASSEDWGSYKFWVYVNTPEGTRRIAHSCDTLYEIETPVAFYYNEKTHLTYDIAEASRKTKAFLWKYGKFILVYLPIKVILILIFN